MTDDWPASDNRLADRLEQTIKDRMVKAMEAGGKLQKQMGEALGWDETKVSKTVRAHRSVAGARTPTAADITAWAAAAGESDESRDETLRLLDDLKAARKSLKDRMRHGRASVQLEYAKLYTDTSRFQIFQAGVIPGILQIGEYARQIFVDLNDATPELSRDVDADVQARLSRAQYLYDPRKEFEILVAESALRFAVADPSVMRLQLDRLISATSMPNVRFGVVPLMRRIHTIVHTGFVVYDDLVIVETPVNEAVFRGEEARIFSATMDRYWSDAIQGEEARALIRSVMEEFATV
jgi:hypothetical protein